MRKCSSREKNKPKIHPNLKPRLAAPERERAAEPLIPGKKLTAVEGNLVRAETNNPQCRSLNQEGCQRCCQEWRQYKANAPSKSESRKASFSLDGQWR